MMKQIVMPAVFAVWLLLSASVASAVQNQSQDGTMTVTATIINSCTLVIGTMGFGNYTAGQASPLNSTANVDVTCDAGVPFMADADAGLNYSGQSRRMSFSANYIAYDLYKDADRAQKWGSTSGGSAFGGTGTGSVVSTTIHGQIFGGQEGHSGAYSDSIQVTVTW